MKNQHKIILGVVALGLVSGSWYLGGRYYSSHKKDQRNLTDEALLALIKNDQKAFESFIRARGNLQAELPLIDGTSYTVSEGLAYFERPNFISYLQANKLPFIKQEEGRPHDVVSLSIPKNNPELLNLLVKEGPELDRKYGKTQWTLLHLASALCSHKLTEILEQGGLRWDQRAKDGSTPLTLAAENGCLPMLGYWKEQKANFNKKDGRGLSAMAILRKKKDAALVAFRQSFETRKPSSAPREVDFYRKRKIPKDQLADHSAIIEPEIRPLESIETADISEFSD